MVCLTIVCPHFLFISAHQVNDNMHKHNLHFNCFSIQHLPANSNSECATFAEINNNLLLRMKVVLEMSTSKVPHKSLIPEVTTCTSQQESKGALINNLWKTKFHFAIEQ